MQNGSRERKGNSIYFLIAIAVHLYKTLMPVHSTYHSLNYPSNHPVTLIELRTILALTLLGSGPAPPSALVPLYLCNVALIAARPCLLHAVNPTVQHYFQILLPLVAQLQPAPVVPRPLAAFSCSWQRQQAVLQQETHLQHLFWGESGNLNSSCITAPALSS